MFCCCREIIADEETTFSRTLVKGLEQFHKMVGGAGRGGSGCSSLPCFCVCLCLPAGWPAFSATPPIPPAPLALLLSPTPCVTAPVAAYSRTRLSYRTLPITNQRTWHAANAENVKLACSSLHYPTLPPFALQQAANAKDGKLAGPDAFMLWDTYGFPVDLTEVRPA